MDSKSNMIEKGLVECLLPFKKKVNKSCLFHYKAVPSNFLMHPETKLRNLTIHSCTGKYVSDRLSDTQIILRESGLCIHIKSLGYNPLNHRGSAPDVLSSDIQINYDLLNQKKVFTQKCNLQLLHHSIYFSSFSCLIQPYMLHLERTNSGKSLISVQASVAHTLASRAIINKQCSDASSNSHICTLTSRRQQIVIETPNEGERHSCLSKNRSEDEDKRTTENNNNLINLIGALTAVEQNDLNSLKTILSKNSFDINASLDSGLYREFRQKQNLLDIALMLGNNKCVTVLQDCGASVKNDMDVSQRRRLVVDVMQRLENKSSQLAHNNITAKDDEKRIKHIIGHLMLLRKMHHTLSKNEPVGHVIDARVFVSSSSEAVVEFFSPPNSLTNVIIQYKVEWSCSPTFNKIEGSLLITDMRQTCVKIPNLIHGQFYSFRITAGSMFGYGQQILAAPTQIKISSWEDVDGVVVGSSGSQNHRELINTLSREVDRLRNSTVWQRVFPVISDGLIKKKKLGLKHLFSASSKFVKHANKGIYLACIIYTNDKILTTVDDMLPIMTIEESNYKGLSANDIKWLMKLSQCWDEIYSIQDATTSCSNNFQFRGLTVETVLSMINALGLKDIGKVHHAPIVYEQNGSIFIVTVRYAIENQILQGLAMKWITLNKFMRKKNSCAAIDYLNTEAINILNFYEASQIPLNRGLYLCYLKMESTLNTIRLMVPDNMPSTLPFVCIRDNPHVSSEEWDWIQKLNDNPENLSNHSSPTNDERDTPESSASIIQNIFHEKLYRAVNLLLSDLEVAPENFGQHRLYRLNVFQMDSDVSMILMVPKTDEVCLMSIGNNSISALDYGKGCTTIPIPVFEMIHLSAYQPDFIALYSQLSVFVEYFTMVTQYEYRKSLVENDAKVYKEMLEKLNDFQERLETIWKNARWITNIATEARDLKQTSHFVDVAKIKFEPVSDDFRINLPRNVESKSAGQVVNSLLSTKNGYINDLKKELAYSSMIPKSIQKSVFKSKDNSLFNLDKLFINGKKINHDKVLKNIPNTSPRNSLVDNSANRSPSPRLRSASQGSQFFRFRNKSPYSNPNTPRKGKFTRTETTSVMEESEHPSSQAYDKEDSTQFGMLRVYVAFDCGFSKGSSVRLRVSKTTTSLEVVALVVKQMSHLKDKMEQDIIVESKHEKIKFVEADYCLVVVIGARERRLRNDFKPLHLSAPWNRGKLFVRHTDLVLDAVLCGNEVAV